MSGLSTARAGGPRAATFERSFVHLNFAFIARYP